MRKVITLIISFLLAVPLFACAPPATLKDDLYILYTSDVHCGFEVNLGYAKFKAIVEDTRSQHANVAVVDMGDNIQGGTIAAATKGDYVIDVMNEIGYDAVTIGNHEFDYGMEQLRKLIDKATFPITACNIRYTGAKENVLSDIPPYIMKEYDGVKVAFIGVITPASIASSTPVNFQENGTFVYDFYSKDKGMELAEKVQSTVDQARKEGAQYVILLTHLGQPDEYQPFDSVSLIHHTNGIDAVLDGHAHVTIIGDYYPNKDGKDVILSSVGTKMQNVGELIISPDGTISTVLISEYDREDEKIKQTLTELNQALDLMIGHKIGETAFDLPMTDENGIRISRSREVAIGDLLTDIFREKLGTDVALINGGAIRNSLAAGDITYRDALDVAPFMNTLSVCRASGQQILDALEFGAKNTESIYVFEDNPVGEAGAFLQVSGLKYTIDTSIPSGVIQDDNKMMTGIEGERRVKDVYVLQNGEYVPLDPQAMYLVGSIDYVITKSGDGNTAFQGAEVTLEGGMTDIDVITEYIASIGTIPEQYAQPDGRITVK
ncbi:MAG: bifunctional metallophosphatase/5'-nucleotidase [Solobacterium sp.]|nr:bifunctional metallophosphatase/5'-nucleotidase [Solobacterium sp.]